MNIKAIRIAVVILGLITLVSSLIMIPLMTSEILILTMPTVLLLLIMFCGFLMIITGLILDDKYTTYDKQKERFE